MRVGKCGGAWIRVVHWPILSTIFMLLGLLVACAPAPEPLPEPTVSCELPSLLERGLVQITPVPGDLDIIENQGRICFYPTPDASFNIGLSPAGCYASHCTLIYERTGDLEVDLETKALQFNSRFVVQSAWQVWEPDAGCVCAADCGGAGIWESCRARSPLSGYRRCP